jgi:hypothetical protein
MAPRVLADLPPPEATSAPSVAVTAAQAPQPASQPTSQATSAPSASAGVAGTTAPTKGPVVLPELQSGEKLLVEAYALMWVLAFAFLLLVIRRQRTADERLARLEAALAARAEAPKPKKAGAGEAKGLTDEG